VRVSDPCSQSPSHNNLSCYSLAFLAVNSTAITNAHSHCHTPNTMLMLGFMNILEPILDPQLFALTTGLKLSYLCSAI
jgi:hypothetical protein